MKLTKASAQAALAVAYLAEHSDNGLIQARQIAEHLNVPTDSALKILQSLARQGLIRSQLGRAGGYALDREPDDLTLLDIFEAIDGPITASVPVTDEDPTLAAGVHTLQQVANRAVEHVRAELASTTVASMMPQPAPAVAAALS